MDVGQFSCNLAAWMNESVIYYSFYNYCGSYIGFEFFFNKFICIVIKNNIFGVNAPT